MQPLLMPEKQEFYLNVILVKDQKGLGFTGFFAEFPEVIAEGKDEKETERNLIDTLIGALDFKKQTLMDSNTMFGHDVVTKQLKFAEA